MPLVDRFRVNSSSLIDDKTSFERLASGFTFTEGPVWLRDDESLLFSDMRGNARARWSRREGAQIVSTHTHKGNGMTLALDGRLLVCEHDTSTLVAMDPSGDGSGREVVASHYDGRELNSPNDVVARADGTLWFTDPPAGRRNNVSGTLREVELDFEAVFCRHVDGTLEPIAKGFELCNGLCFAPDGSCLYVTETMAGTIRKITVDNHGQATADDVFANFFGPFDECRGWLDGVRCDAEGNLWSTGPDGIWILSPNGQAIALLHTPEIATNLTWGEDDLRTLFVTAGGSVYSIRTKIPGLPLHYA